MFLVLEDDGCLHVYASPKAAAMEIEALDVEDVAIAAFDDEARPYRVDWIRPNSHGRTLGIVPWAVNGEYRFIVAGEADVMALVAIIRNAVAISPRDQDGRVQELLRRFASTPRSLPIDSEPE